MSFWVYSRTSGDEDDTGQDVDSQEAQVRQDAKVRSWAVAGASQDNGVSGDSDPADRPGFKQAVAAVQAGIAKAVLVREASRFSRQHPAVALLSFRQFQASGVPVVSVTEPDVDGRRPPNLTDDLVLFIRFMMSASYLEAVRKGTGLAMREIKEGRRKTKSGRPPGQPRKVNEAEARAAADRIEAGASLRSAAHLLSEDRGAFQTTDAAVRRKRMVSHQALAEALEHFGLSKNANRSGTEEDQGTAGPVPNGPHPDQAGNQATKAPGRTIRLGGSASDTKAAPATSDNLPGSKA